MIVDKLYDDVDPSDPIATNNVLRMLLAFQYDNFIY